MSLKSTTASFKLDYDAVVRVKYTTPPDQEEEDIADDEKKAEEQKEEAVLSHKQVLSLFSPVFSRMIANAEASAAATSSSSSSSSAAAAAAALPSSSSPTTSSDDVEMDEEEVSENPKNMTSIELDLTMFPNALAAFKIMLEALYTGEVKLTTATPDEVLSICRYCQVSSIESKIMALQHQLAFNINNLFNTPTKAATVPLLIPPSPANSTPTLFDVLMAQQQQIRTPAPSQPAPTPASAAADIQFPAYFASMLQFWNSPLFGASAASSTATLGGGGGSTMNSFSPKSDGSSSRTQSEGSSPRANSVASSPPNNDLEKIVPNDDKEGWCRNKKYIEKVENGFMCTVCRKIYGRYNSVSYHVTIYHRNPPIRCEESGCNFSTREARYIHFHKYYRHHIPLPDNIDLGSRKCPFCRHVSKSPAMLDKHIARHETENGHTGALKRAANRKKTIPPPTLPDLMAPSPSSTNILLLPNSPLTNSVVTPLSSPIQCSMCPFTAFTTEMFFVHLASSHVAELTRFTDSTTATTTASSGDSVIDEDAEEVTPFQINPLKLELDTSI